jgi:hypothetical protein
MLTGFTVVHREKDEEKHVYWEPIRYLQSYMWMFRKEDCQHPNCEYCNDPTAPGCCIVFTYK